MEVAPTFFAERISFGKLSTSPKNTATFRRINVHMPMDDSTTEPDMGWQLQVVLDEVVDMSISTTSHNGASKVV